MAGTLFAPLVDERGIETWPYVEWVPPEGSRRPVVHNVRVPLPGDRATVRIEYFLFDLKSGRRTIIQLPEGYPELSWPSGWAPSWAGAKVTNRPLSCRVRRAGKRRQCFALIWQPRP